MVGAVIEALPAVQAKKYGVEHSVNGDIYIQQLGRRRLHHHSNIGKQATKAIPRAWHYGADAEKIAVDTTSLPEA